MKTFHYIVKDDMGIHARTAGMIAEQAKKYQSDITLSKGTQEADATKLFALVRLAVKQGNEITIAINGIDEERAYQEFAQWIRKHL